MSKKFIFECLYRRIGIINSALMRLLDCVVLKIRGTRHKTGNKVLSVEDGKPWFTRISTVVDYLHFHLHRIGLGDQSSVFRGCSRHVDIPLALGSKPGMNLAGGGKRFGYYVRQAHLFPTLLKTCQQSPPGNAWYSGSNSDKTRVI